MRSWPFGAVGLVVTAIALLATPTRVEGAVLVPISPGHALAVLDSIALIPLLIGLAVLGGMGASLPDVRFPVYITREG